MSIIENSVLCAKDVGAVNRLITTVWFRFGLNVFRLSVRKDLMTACTM